MVDIYDALESLSEVHRKHHISGVFLASNDVMARWPKWLPRSFELEVLYNQYDPVGVKFETGLTPLKLFDIASLDKGQLGYRFINSTEGSVQNKKWPDHHLVIMDDNGGGKPIIAITNIDKTPVFAGYDVVEPFQVAESLADFIFALSRLMGIVYGEFNVFDISDDDGISNAFLARLNHEVAPILGVDNTSRFVDYFYG